MTSAVQAEAPRPDPSGEFVNSFRAAAARMEGLDFVNPALSVEAVAFAPWQGHWLGVLITPWFMNLILAPRDSDAWPMLRPGDRQGHTFPAGVYDFIAAHDDVAGDYQMCSLFSPLLHFDDQETARLVAGLAREALFDDANAEKPDSHAGTLSPNQAGASPVPGPLQELEAQLHAPQSKRDFLRARWKVDDRGHRG
jgi:[NiFe] hydrogenase assembly HybE family chaperone